MDKKEFRVFKREMLSILKTDLDGISRLVKGLLMSIQKQISESSPIAKPVVKRKKIMKVPVVKKTRGRSKKV